MMNGDTWRKHQNIFYVTCTVGMAYLVSLKLEKKKKTHILIQFRQILSTPSYFCPVLREY